MRTIINRFPVRGFVSMRWCSLLVLVLASLSASCAYQPWSIETYIQSLERPERDEYQQPAKVMEALNLTPGMVVADVGAGSGYFTRRFAKAVGETGKVLAIDVEQNMLDYNKQELEKLGMANRPHRFGGFSGCRSGSSQFGLGWRRNGSRNSYN